MRFDYTAARHLATGHTADEDYSIVVGAAELLPDFDRVGRQVRAHDGTTESNLERLDVIYDVTTDLIEVGQEDENFREFLASVANSEPFTFDPEATSALDVAPVTAELDLQRFPRPRREGPRHFRWTLRIRVIG